MTTDAVGGVWTYALELIRLVAAGGVEVDLAVLGPPPSDGQRQAAGRAGVADLHENEAALEWMEDPWDEVHAAGAWLLELERRLWPDVVHLNGFVHGALPWRTPVVVVGHSCVLSWWEAVKGEPAPSSWARYREEVSRGLGCATAVVAPTRWMLAELQRLYDLRDGRVIHNGLEAGSTSPGGPRREVVVTAGRLWDEAKNLATLLSIAGDLVWPLEVAGADLSPAPPNVESLGSIPRADLLTRLQRAGLFVLPARYEPFGLGPLEAAQAGCALVLGDIPSLRELWEGAAVFVDPVDAHRLRDACNELIASPELRDEWAARAWARARDFDGRSMATRYQKLYRDLASSRVAGRAMAGGAR